MLERAAYPLIFANLRSVYAPVACTIGEATGRIKRAGYCWVIGALISGQAGLRTPAVVCTTISFVQGEGRMTKLESKFQRSFMEELRQRYPEAIVVKNDANYLQGVPDVLMLLHDTWAAFEVKPYRDARTEPNQKYYVRLMNDMSFAAFVYPENKDEVLDALQFALASRGAARLP